MPKTEHKWQRAEWKDLDLSERQILIYGGISVCALMT